MSQVYYIMMKNDTMFALLEADSLGHANKLCPRVFGTKNAPFRVRLADEQDLTWASLSKAEVHK